MGQFFQHYFLPCLWAFFSCLGFGLVFNVHGAGILICGLGSGLGWLVYLIVTDFGLSDIFSAFLAAMVIAAYAEAMAQIGRAHV